MDSNIANVIGVLLSSLISLTDLPYYHTKRCHSISKCRHQSRHLSRTKQTNNTKPNKNASRLAPYLNALVLCPRNVLPFKIVMNAKLNEVKRTSLPEISDHTVAYTVSILVSSGWEIIGGLFPFELLPSPCTQFSLKIILWSSKQYQDLQLQEE